MISRQGFKEALANLLDAMKREEREVGYLSGERRGGVIVVEHRVAAAFVGDIHGDLVTMRAIMKSIERESSEKDLVIFLGDYIDRGPPEGQIGVMLELSEAKLSMGKRLVLLRGNHEVMRGLEPYPHDYPIALRSLFSEGWLELYSLSRELFDSLPHAIILRGFALALHGGPPTRPAKDALEYLSYDRNVDRMEEILYNDPYEMSARDAPSPRGAGKLWGAPVTEEALSIVGARYIIRGHEAVAAGYKLNHGGRVLTLFSRKGAPYYNSRAAYALCEPDEGISSCVKTL